MVPSVAHCFVGFVLVRFMPWLLKKFRLTFLNLLFLLIWKFGVCSWFKYIYSIASVCVYCWLWCCLFSLLVRCFIFFVCQACWNIRMIEYMACPSMFLESVLFLSLLLCWVVRIHVFACFFKPCFPPFVPMPSRLLLTAHSIAFWYEMYVSSEVYRRFLLLLWSSLLAFAVSFESMRFSLGGRRCKILYRPCPKCR